MTDRRNDPTLATHAPSTDGGAKGGMRLLDAGERIGRYTIVSLLGRGGMGAVYEAQDPELARRVAIKVLHEDRDETERDALKREAQALATLVHQNVVMVYDVGVDEDGDVFLVMQLVEGETIDAWIERTKPTTDEILAKFKQAGAGLAAAHAAGLVHCDFKPANVLIDELGTVRVGDFGLARRSNRITARSGKHTAPTVMTTLAGTPAYMAPEQFDGLVTPASDQFAFCVALWECLAGERPFADSSVATLDPASRGPRRELPAAKVPRHVRDVLERGMADAPVDRFSSINALLAALEPKRSPTLMIAAIAGAAILGGAVVFLATRSNEPGQLGWDGADLAGRTNLTSMKTEGCAYAPMVDPNGTVIFDRTRGEVVDLYAVPLAGGAMRQLTSGPHWEWRAQRGSKPGEITYLLHARLEGETSQVMRLDLATGSSFSLLRAESWDAITVGDQLFYSPNASGGIWVLKNRVQQAFVIPDKGFTYLGLTASYAGDQLGITRLDTNGGAVGAPCTIDVATAKPRCFEGLFTNTRPAFGRDSHILYVAALDGILRLDLTTGYITKLTDDYAEGGITVAPDGSALVFSLCRTHTNIIDPVTNKVLLDDLDGTQPAIASDGSIAWVHTIGNRQVLMLRDATGAITQLTRPEQGSVTYPRFSQNNKFVVFAMTKPNPGIHVIELDKRGSLRDVTKDDKDYYPHFVDNDLIAFSQVDEDGNEKLFTVKLDGNDRRPLSTASRALYGSKGKEILVSGVKTTLWLDPVTGAERPGPPRPDDEPEAGATSPSGEWVVYQLGADGHTLYRTRTDGSSKLELVRRFDSSFYVNKPSISDDGQVIVSAGPMYGDLVKIPAKPGAHF